MTREEKMKIVINNYFKTECSVNTSIREAFEKGFRIGASKVQKKPEVGTDCISRQSAIDAFNTNLNELVVGGEENAKTVENYLNRVLDKIKCLPSAQPEIIRCKDCKYAEYIDDVKTLWCTECGQGRTVAPYDFCSYGERREDG